MYAFWVEVYIAGNNIVFSSLYQQREVNFLACGIRSLITQQWVLMKLIRVPENAIKMTLSSVKEGNALPSRL